MKKPPSLILREIRSSWWLFAFTLVTFCIYEQASHHLVRKMKRLEQKMEKIETELEHKKKLNKELLCQVESQNDPAWIELSLIRVLGLVPEGYTKVFFTEEEKGK